MTVHRGRVTAVDTAGVFVRVAALGPDVVGPLEWLGSKPAVDDGVIVVNTGTESSPDLLVMAAGEFSRLTSLTVRGSGDVDADVSSSDSEVYFRLAAATGHGVYQSYHVGAVSNGTRKFVIQSGDATWILFACDDTGNPFAGREGFRVERATGRVLLGRATVTADTALTVAHKGYVDAIKSALAASSDFADFKSRVGAL